jgi:hypothetical protein
MVIRRTLLGASLLPLLARRAGAAPADIAFRVVREGSVIGTHTVRFREDDAVLRARTEIRVQVKLVGLTVYSFAQDTEEAWRDARLVALQSRSERNGHAGVCQADAEVDGLHLRGTAGQAVLPASACPLTWWRMANLTPGIPLFDVREGLPVAPRLERRAEGGLSRIRVIGGEGAVVTYDARGNWVGFATTGEDGSAVTYERI